MATVREQLRARIPDVLARGHWRILEAIHLAGAKGGITDREIADRTGYSLDYERRLRRNLSRLRLIGVLEDSPREGPWFWAIADPEFVEANLGRFGG